MTGTLIKANMNYDTNSIYALVEFKTDNLDALNELNTKDLEVEIKKKTKKRSLNANNYAWELITQIGNVLRMDKEEVYFRMLQSYGQSQMISVLSDIDVSRFIKYYSKAGESILNGKNFTHYKVYTGSSEYDTKEMSILIDGIVQECKNLGIETLPPNELKSLKESWK